MHIIDQPRCVPRSTYESLIEKIAQSLIASPAVQSIYQVGSVRHPGISDLDLVCVFQGEGTVNTNIRQQLNEDERYILTHNLFGIHHNQLKQGFKYSFYTGYRLVDGEDMNIAKNPVDLIDPEIKRQIALEFMLKMYISMYTQITYGTIKLRAFLLEAKAIAFDLEILNLEQHPLADMVNRVNRWRDEWFDKSPSHKEVALLFKSFFSGLEEILSTQMLENEVYLPYEEVAISRNIGIQPGKAFQMDHRGFSISAFMPIMSRKLLNLQNRFNTFTLKAPYSTHFKGTVFEERFLFYEQLWAENKQNYPHFIPPTTGIRLWKPSDFS